MGEGQGIGAGGCRVWESGRLILDSCGRGASWCTWLGSSSDGKPRMCGCAGCGPPLVSHARRTSCSKPSVEL
eukprot:351479-Chlamydomonas_euryale.AAC.2